MQNLKRNAVGQSLRRKDTCALAQAGRNPSRNLALIQICQCNECQLARSILRGQKLWERKQRQSENIQKFLTSPTILSTFFHAGFKNSFTILSFSVTLALPFMFPSLFADTTEVPRMEASSGFLVSEELIEDAIKHTPIRPPVAPVIGFGLVK